MKLSNKIIITFGLALILIPLLGMVYVSRVKYKVGTFTDVTSKIEELNKPSQNMTTMVISTPFKSINIADGKGIGFNIHFIKDAKYGIKVSNDFKDQVSYSVNTNGELQLVVKENPSKDKQSYYTDLYVYSPTLTAISVAQADGVYIGAEVDSLSINIKKSGVIGFDPDFKIGKLNVNAENVTEIRVREGKINSLMLNLKATNFISNRSSYNDLTITSDGAETIEITGDNDDDKELKYIINNLTINTSNKGDVKFEQIKINNCAGHFSDQTTVQMPAVNLNQMYKK